MAMTTAQLALARMELADPGTSAQQSIGIAGAESGTFTITYSAQTTSALAYNAGANVVQNALCALSNVGVGNITVNTTPGTPDAIYYAVYFAGTLAHVAQPMLTLTTTGLTGTDLATSVSQTLAGGVQAFSDDEINAEYTQAKNDYYLTICYCYRVLWANAAKFNDYTAGQSSEKKSQVRDGLMGLAEKYEEWARAGKQVLLTSLIPEPPRLIATPWMAGAPSTSLQYRLPFGPRYPWRRGGW